jgi:hypothetical protein
MTKKMDIKEFRDLGYLQEVNRQFFHPLGLALSVRAPMDEEGGEWSLDSILDARDDPEGFIYSDGVDRAKTDYIHRQWEAKEEERSKLFNYGTVQPTWWKLDKPEPKPEPKPLKPPVDTWLRLNP